MDDHVEGQVAASAAEVYEAFFVPALFAEWPERVLDAAEVAAGRSVLDIACGTGVLSRAAALRVGDAGSVVGIDINEGMLAVARGSNASVHWQLAPAESLPFADDAFDHVVSQFGLMFFQDKVAAIKEMLRVLKPGMTGCVAVWASLSQTPGYSAIDRLLTDVFDTNIASAIEAPFSLGDIAILGALFADAGAKGIAIETVSGTARFESIDAWLYTDIRGWTLAEVIDDEGYARLRQAAPGYLSVFADEDGHVEFESPAHLVRFNA